MVSAPIERHILRFPELYPKQRAAIFAPERIAVIEATTKAGKTVGCIVWQTERAWKDNATHLWVAPIFPQARIAFQRLCRFLIKADPDKGCWDDNKSDLSVSFQSGSKIVYRGSDDPDSIYGPDYADAVIDEATRCKEEAWYAVRSTLTATRGPVRIIGNVKGRKNWAYKMARRAEKGEAGMHYAKLTAADAVEGGVIEADEIEEARAILPENVFRELYYAEPSDDEGNPFGLEAIRSCTVEEMGEKPIVAWGGDLAKSHDWTVMVGLNEHGEVAAFQRWQGDWRGTTARIAAMVKDTPALIDATGVGDPIVESLQRQCANVQGYKFTGAPTGKQQLMEGLAVALQNTRVKYPRMIQTRNANGDTVRASNPLIMELESFEYSIKLDKDSRVTRMSYSAPGGMHDDCVCALALAVRCMQTRPTSPRLWGVGGEQPVDRFASDYNEFDDERLWQPV